ncbi:peritrophin-1-like [Anopheles coustani]|uniref:peritrophin-1-like n=1 Tax=Anopheles coustani TaxID=139045 RepID=UPI002659D86E|nr:peritrophin-1-like [Anopheles coustani]
MKAIIFFVLLCAVVTAHAAERTCPERDDIFNPVHIPHETECTKFYKCLNGEKIEMDCPENLHWNIEQDYCDYPDVANCVRPIIHHSFVQY